MLSYDRSQDRNPPLRLQSINCLRSYSVRIIWSIWSISSQNRETEQGLSRRSLSRPSHRVVALLQHHCGVHGPSSFIILLLIHYFQHIIESSFTVCRHKSFRLAGLVFWRVSLPLNFQSILPDEISSDSYKVQSSAGYSFVMPKSKGL